MLVKECSIHNTQEKQAYIKSEHFIGLPIAIAIAIYQLMTIRSIHAFSWKHCCLKISCWVNLVCYDSSLCTFSSYHIPTYSCNFLVAFYTCTTGTHLYNISVGMCCVCVYPYNTCLFTSWSCHPYFTLQFSSIVFILSLVCTVLLMLCMQHKPYEIFNLAVRYGSS